MLVAQRLSLKAVKKVKRALGIEQAKKPVMLSYGHQA
jgi:hypothetical protein